ncbi:ribbon-helix-helix protein, CopG family [bacterium]|nr:ribbon-helix-helix protein, CopG family [bacterium]
MRTMEALSFTFPSGMIKEIKELAKKERKTRSQLARDALLQYMQTKKWHDIQRKMAIRARTLGITSEADVERIVHEHRGVKI